MEKQDLKEIQRKIGYQFNNIALLFQAFTRKSYSNQFGGENNEVLEFLGDEILDFYVTKIIADNFGLMKSQSDYYIKGVEVNEYSIVAHKNEADFTDLKKEIVKNETLARRIDELEFFQYMYLGDSDKTNPKFKENLTKVKADLFEAILGAIAIDSDWDSDALQYSVEQMIQIDAFLENVDIEEERPNEFKLENAINTLKELSEQGICSIPQYELSEEQVRLQDGRLMWECTCYVGSWSINRTAYETSKKLAKKYAAYLVLCNHFNVKNEYED